MQFSLEINIVFLFNKTAVLIIITINYNIFGQEIWYPKCLSHNVLHFHMNIPPTV